MAYETALYFTVILNLFQDPFFQLTQLLVTRNGCWS